MHKWVLAARAHPGTARTHLFTLIYKHKGVLRPLPTPSLLLSSSHSLYTTMRLEIFIILFI